MVKVKVSSIIREATEIKKFTEKEKSLPKTCTLDDGQVFNIYDMSFMMANVLLNTHVEMWNFNKGIQGYNVKKYTDKLNNVKVSESRYMDMASRFVSYSKKNNRVPSNILVTGEIGGSSFELFTYCLAKILTFFKQNHTLPKYCLFNKADITPNTKTTTNTKKTAKTSTSNKPKNTNCTNPYVSKPHLTTTKTGLGQNYHWDCSANSVQQALYKLSGKTIKEDALIKVGGVTTKGVGHEGINTMIAWFNKKYKTNYQVKWINFSSLADTRDKRFEELGKIICKPDNAVITHIGYSNAGGKIGSQVFGHYEVLDKINTKTKYVRALNSLGNQMNKNAFYGHLQDRSFEVQAHYFASTPGGQSALCIITKK